MLTLSFLHTPLSALYGSMGLYTFITVRYRTLPSPCPYYR